jgi:hypothetical protein
MLKHMLWYYKETANLGLKYCRDRKNADINNLNYLLGLTAYSDSAHGKNTERKSTVSYVIFIASGVVFFKAYWRRLVAHLSTESKYITMMYTAKEIS